MNFKSSETKSLLRLALPVVISQVGAMLMGLTDTIVVGRYSSIDLAGVAAGNSVFWTVAIVGLGLLNGMDPIVAQANGAGRREDADRCLGAALQISILFTLLLTPLIYAASRFLHLLGAEAQVIDAARPFLLTLGWGLLPLMIYGAFQKYWQGFEIALPFTIIILGTNVLNLIFVLLLVPGRYGLPAFGAQGAALSTLICRLGTLFAALGLTAYLWKKRSFSDRPWSYLWRLLFTVDKEMMRRLVKLGLPAASQILLEVFAFNFTTMIVTRLGATILATHHIVLNIASFAFMFPLGLSTAIATRVGFHLGRGHEADAHHAGWLGILFAFLFMLLSAMILFIFPEALLRLFTEDTKVIELGVTIISLCVLFQVFDGVQVASAGALRGLGDTRTAFFTNLLAHYGVGLPVGLSLCFLLGKGLYGLWIGLAMGLAVTAVLNVWVWRRKLRIQT